MTRIFLNHWVLRRGLAVAGAGFLLVSGVATAQVTSGGTSAAAEATRGGGLEEVVVTATRRSENLQEVPIAVTAFTAEQMQSRGVTDIHSLSNLTPNVNLDAGAPFSGDTSVLSASIRGIGQDDFAFNLDPGVGVYIDGVYLARTIGANQNLLDVDRIEILKGPQGTLFGRNTIGGAVNIVTHTPGNVFSIKGQLTEGQYNRHDALVTVDIPINTNVLSTLSISSQYRDGYQTAIPFPATAPYQVTGQDVVPKAPGSESSSTNGGRNSQTIRGKLLWKVRDDFDATFSGDYTHQNQSGIPNTIMGVFLANSSSYIPPNVTSLPTNAPPPLFTQNIMGNLYNACITTPAAQLDPAYALGPPPGPFNNVNGLCAPMAVGTWNSTTNSYRGNGVGYPGMLALGGSGAVNVPVSVLNSWLTQNPGGAQYVHIAPGAAVGSLLFPNQAPRIYWDFANTQTGNKDTTYSNGPSFAKNDAEGVSATLEWRLTPDMELKSITGWRQITWNIGTDLDGLPESMQEVTDGQGQRQVSQEFQILGKMLDNKLNYVGGLYYFNESGYVHDYVPFDTGYLYVYDYDNQIKTDSYAGYLHLDYKLTDQWGLTAGVRYSHEKKQFLGGQGDLNGFSYKISGCLDPSANANTFFGFGAVPNGVTCQQVLGFPDPTNPLRYFPNQWDNQSWNVWTPTYGIQYHITPDMMAYGSYAKGFKSGGWTTRLSAPITNPADARFNPEYDSTYELGLKSTWLNHHLVANLAAFYSKYTGIQLNVQEGPSPVYQNAGDATIKGAELEMQALFGGGFQLNLSAGWMDAYYTSLNPCLVYNNCDPALGLQTTQGGGGFTLDSKLPKTPDYKVTVSPIWDLHLANNNALRFQADYTLTGGMYNDGPNTQLLYRPATHILDASIHWLPASEHFELVLGGTNLTDDRYITVGSVNYTAGEVVGSYNAPRQWYVTLNMKM
jgi:iron complex outermembrane recepter protein